MLDRLSSFLSPKKRRSSSRRQSDTADGSSLSSPASPVSPRSPQTSEDDGQKTPTPSRKEGEFTRPDEDRRSSSPSATSLADDGGLPFADSSGSGRSSVREMHVCRVSTADDERNSGNVTPTPHDLATSTYASADLASEQGFADSVVKEVSKRLQVNLEENIMQVADTSSQHNAAERTAVPSSVIPPSKTIDPPKSPNLMSISLESRKTSVKRDGSVHSIALSGIKLGSSSSRSSTSSHIIKPQQDDEDAGDGARKNSATVQSLSPDREEVPRSESPVQLHKAIWVETHMGTEEGEGERALMTEREEEGFRADSPPVLAIPVTVIPVEDWFPEAAPGSSPESTVSLAATTGEFQTNPPQPEELSAAAARKSSLQDKHGPKETRVTRKTVRLPSKHSTLSHKALVSPQPSLDENQQAEEEKQERGQTSDTAEAKR